MLSLRRHRLIPVLLALASLLYMQLAVAAYACPVVDKVAEIAAMAEAGLPCAGDMATVDLDQPGLCFAHNQTSDRTTTKVDLPSPVQSMATGFRFTSEPYRARPVAARAQAGPPSRNAAPPIAVLHCCLRI